MTIHSMTTDGFEFYDLITINSMILDGYRPHDLRCL